MAQDTCDRKSCHLWKKYKENCPDYYENWFVEETPEGRGEPFLVHDCAKIRQLLISQEILSRLLAVQQVIEKQRNAFDRVDKHHKQTIVGLSRLIQSTSSVMEINNAEIPAISHLRLQERSET